MSVLVSVAASNVFGATPHVSVKTSGVSSSMRPALAVVFPKVASSHASPIQAEEGYAISPVSIFKCAPDQTLAAIWS